MRHSLFLQDKHLHYRYPELFDGNRKIYCDPVTLTVVAITATAAAGGMTAYGQVQQGKAQSKMYQYQSSLALQKASLTKKIAETNITAVQGSAAEESKRLAREVTELTGAQKATIGALGIGGATAADIALSTFDKAKLDQMAIRYNANVRSWGIGEEAKYNVWSLEEESKQYGVAAKNARRAANINAATTILGTAASIAGMRGMSVGGGGGTPKPAPRTVTV